MCGAYVRHGNFRIKMLSSDSDLLFLLQESSKKENIVIKSKVKEEQIPLPPQTILSGMLGNMFAAGGYLTNLKAKEQDWVFVSDTCVCVCCT